MSLEDYEAFVYGATFCDKEDPVVEWNRIHDEQQKDGGTGLQARIKS